MKKNDQQIKSIQQKVEELEKAEVNKKSKPSELEILKQQLEEYKNKYLRYVADYQNLEKRVEKDKYEWIKMANAELLIKIIVIADDLDRAASFINDAGLNIVRDNLSKVLAEFGVEEIKVLNQKFDHEIMECVDQAEGEKNIVLKVVNKGYRLNGRILRTAKVVVGK